MEVFGDDKRALRAKMRALRRGLDGAQRGEWDARLQAALVGSRLFAQAETVFCYVAFGGEPETRGILRRCLATGRRLAVPLCVSDGIMRAVRLESEGQLHAGYRGILEPDADLPSIDFGEIDLAVTPGLAFTREGKRLGQGGGFYDRFLAQTSAVSVGLCYPPFLLDTLPEDVFDRRVDIVLCPETYFGKIDERTRL